MGAEAARSGSWFAGRAGWADAGPAEERSGVAGRLAAPAQDTTRAGLPMRVPRAHLVPGSFGGGESMSGTPDSMPPERSPDAVRRRLADYHRGVQRGRATS